MPTITAILIVVGTLRSTVDPAGATPAAPGLDRFTTRAVGISPRPRMGTGPLPMEAASTSRLLAQATPVLERLIEQLRSANPGIRARAASGLADIGEAASAAVPALQGRLEEDENAEVRRYAAMALGKIGQAARRTAPALLAAANDKEPKVRREAVLALGRIGAAVDTIVHPLADLLRGDPDRMVRIAVVEVLGGLRPVPEKAVEALASAANGDEGAIVREEAVRRLATIGPKHRAVVPTLAAALRDPDRSVKEVAAKSLERQGRDATPAIPDLIRALEDPQGAPAEAQEALRSIGEPAIPALIAALETLSEDAGHRAVWALGMMGPAPTPALIRAMASKRAHVRRQAIEVFIEMGDKGELAVPALITALRDDEDESVRRSAADALSRIGPRARAAVPALIQALGDPERTVRSEAVSALGRIGPAGGGSLEALASVLKNDLNPEVRLSAAYALPAMASSGAERRTVVFKLIDATKDRAAPVRRAAVSALSGVLPEGGYAVDPLAGLLRDPDQETRSAAAESLGKIGSPSRAAVPALLRALNDPEPGVRENAAEAIGHIGWTGGDVIAPLISLLDDPNDRVRNAAVGAFARLTESAAEARDYSAIGPLGRAASAVRAARDLSGHPFTTSSLDRALDVLKTKEKADLLAWMAGMIERSPVIVLGTTLVILYSLWLFTLRFLVLPRYPLNVLAWGERLTSISEWEWKDLLKVKIPANAVLLANLHEHPLVLDAWVARHAPAAREHFLRSDTVATRLTYVAIPLLLDGNVIPCLDIRSLAPIRTRERWSVVIWGEGGSGKTTLACQLALHGLADDPGERVCPDVRMLPVLIEPGLGFDACKDIATFRAAVRGQLQQMIGAQSAIPDWLFDRLLRTRRILVLLDGLSEMTTHPASAAGERARPTHPDFPASALIVTSRARESDASCTLSPLRLDRDHLIPFVSAYLVNEGLGHLPDATIFHACARLADLVGPERGITPLLARLYIEEAAHGAGDGSPALEPPSTIPGLMLAYLNTLNRTRTDGDPENPVVQRVAREAAWACLRTTYRPGPAKKADILEGLGDLPAAGSILGYLEHRLRVLRTIPPEETHVEFDLDPLAEYLAASRLVETNRRDRSKWKSFLERADKQPGAPEAIRGLLLAVLDCVAAMEPAPPEGIREEIVRRLASDVSARSPREPASMAVVGTAPAAGPIPS